jgi:ATP-binding cassette subfamily B protein/subfamily B ATP-binding cassette protein MsbA
MNRHRTLLRYVRPHAGAFAWLSLLAVMSAGVVALQPWPMKLIVDHLLGAKPPPDFLQALERRPSPASLLALLVLAGLLLTMAKLVLESFQAWLWIKEGRRMVYALAEDVFARLQQRSLLFHQRQSVGEWMSRVTTDTWCVYFLVDTLGLGPAHALLSIAAMAVLMAQLDGPLTGLALAIAPCMVAASLLGGRPLRAMARLRREMEGRLASHVQQTLTGLPVVQAFSQEEREHERFQQFAEHAIRAQQRSTLVGSLNALSSGLVATLGAGLILWFGARKVTEGTLTVGGLLVFLAYLASLQAQMKSLAPIYTALQGFGASVERVIDVLHAPPEIQDRPAAVVSGTVRGHVQFEGVTFGYEPGRAVLRHIDLEAKPGEILALVGASGAGKTTLVNLVPRFFDPWEGRVLLDGRDVRDLQVKGLRRQIGLVLQEPFLLPGSVAENLAYGRLDATRAELEAAARDAQAHEFIARLAQGYDTPIGERGATLSGGERQRLSIARALLKNAPILILDEPTSALDAPTEHLLLQALQRLMRGRTTFLIAHRLSTVRWADRIVVLQEGQITERGTYQELMARGRFFAQLHNIQFDPMPRAASPSPRP